MTNIQRAALLACFLASSTLAARQVPAVVETPLAGDIMQATVHRLSNGLTVYLSPNHDKPRVTAWIVVRSGARHDPADCTGLAHYLEHLLFKGTAKLGTTNWGKERPHLDRVTALYEERFTATDSGQKERLYGEIDRENVQAARYAVPDELGRLYGRLGLSDINAFTMGDGTAYVCTFPRNRAEVWARVEADRFAHPVFRLFTTELETVYEEKNMSIDNPETGLWEALLLALFPEHPYGTQPALGRVEHLKNPSLQRVYDQFRSHYVPNNMAVLLAGDFERAPMLALLERTLGAWKPAAVPSPQAFPIPPPQGVKRVGIKFEAEEKVMIAWMTVPVEHPDADALTVMDMLVDNAATGIVNLDLVQQQKVKVAGSVNGPWEEAGFWMAWAVPKKDQTLEQAEELLLGCVDRIRKGEFTDEDIRAVVTNWEVGEKRALESDEERVDRMMRSFLREEEWARTAAWLERARKVTKADVVRVARQYLGGSRVVVFRRSGKPDLPSIAKPSFTKVEIDQSRSSAFAREIEAIPAVPIEPRWAVAGKDFTVADHAFGRLFTGPNPMNDVFTIKFGWPHGTSEEKELGAALDLFDKAGAGDLDAAAYRRRLYALGSSVSFAAGERFTTVEVSGLETRLEETLRLVLERFTTPRVERGTLEKMVDVAIGAHRDNKKSPDYVFGALAGWAGRGPGSPVLRELSDAEYRALDQGRLLRLARSVWDMPGDIRYVGTRTAAELAAVLAAVLPAPSTPRRPPRTVAYIKPPAARVLFTHRDMVQSKIYLYAADGVLDPARFTDYEFFYELAGGGTGAVVFQEMREARALAYSAWGGYRSGQLAGDENRVLGYVATQADKTIEAATLLRDLMRATPVTVQKFREVKRAIIESYRTNPIHFRDVPESVLRWEEQGLPPGDPRPEWFARAGRYTQKDLEAFAKRFGSTVFSLAILGNRDRVDMEKLKALGQFEEIPLDKLFPY